jgi:NAD(P)-dependent dehydrogenase (short-subunit alcohol dehydrogenase family)
MKDFKNKVAVITGAANGIGFGIAERCAQEGMKVVLAGINEENLLKAAEKLEQIGAALLVVRTDVSKREDVEMLAQKTLDTFGAVHLLVNNAGVGAGTSVWESMWEDWEWVINVNLWGVLYGVKVFTPLMLAQGTEAHIVNVASVAGFLSSHPSAPYTVTKHAVVALTESMYYSLVERDAKLKVSVLCPGWVKTSILKSGRNRPAELNVKPSRGSLRREDLDAYRRMEAALEAGMSIEELADHVMEAIRAEQLFVLTHPEHIPQIQERFENILGQKNPAKGSWV